jgi:hypothetical protein
MHWQAQNLLQGGSSAATIQQLKGHDWQQQQQQLMHWQAHNLLQGSSSSNAATERA